MNVVNVEKLTTIQIVAEANATRYSLLMTDAGSHVVVVDTTGRWLVKLQHHDLYDDTVLSVAYVHNLFMQYANMSAIDAKNITDICFMQYRLIKAGDKT